MSGAGARAPFAEEKWALVLEAAAVPQAELGAFLRRKESHEALVEWREAAMAGLQRPSRSERKAANHMVTATDYVKARFERAPDALDRAHGGQRRSDPVLPR